VIEHEEEDDNGPGQGTC